MTIWTRTDQFPKGDVTLSDHNILAESWGKAHDVPRGVLCPPQIWSVWDIVNLFDVYSLSHILHKLTQAQMTFWFPKMGGHGHLSPNAEARTRAENVMAEAKALFTLAQLPDCLQAVESAKHQWDRPMLDNSAAVEIMHRLQIDVIGAMGRRQFLRVAEDRLDMLVCYRGDKPHFGAQEVFGTDVIAAFDSASPDIEAGNCLAAECN